MGFWMNLGGVVGFPGFSLPITMARPPIRYRFLKGMFGGTLGLLGGGIVIIPLGF